MEEQSDSPEPLWYTLNIAMREKLEREAAASFCEIWPHDVEQFAEGTAGGTSETSDEKVA